MDLNIHDFYCLGALLLSMWNDHSHRKVNFKSAFLQSCLFAHFCHGEMFENDCPISNF